MNFYHSKLQMIKYLNSSKSMLLCGLFIGSFSISAQILNVDREKGQDSLSQRISLAANIGLSIDRQQVYLTQGTAGLEVALRSNKKHLLLIKAEGSALFANDQALEENGFATIRFRDQDFRTIYPDLFIQYQWNTVLGLKHRWVAGGNARLKLLDNQNLDLFASIGGFYENEVWDPSISQFTFEDSILQSGIRQRILARANSYLKSGIRISKSTDLVLINYIQFPLSSDFLKPRWHLQASFITSISKRIEFYLRYSHVYDVFRVLPINSFFFVTDFGIQVTY